MSTPSSTPVHPLTFQHHERIDILYGGTESEVLKESIDLCRDLMSYGMKDDQEVLYINTLISARAFEPHARRAIKDVRLNRRFRTITLLEHGLAKRLDFLKKTITEKNIRYVILNGFEFATLTSRHRLEIFFWLKSLRDQSGASVIIFTQSGPRRYGTLGQMRFVSETCEEVGAYCRANEDEEKKAAAAASKTTAPVKKTESEIFEAKIKKDETGAPLYNYDRQKLQMLREKEEAERAASAPLVSDVNAGDANVDDAYVDDANSSDEQVNETLKTKELEVADVASFV